MELSERIKCLAAIDLFASFPEEELTVLAGVVEEVFCEAGTVLCREGDPGREMYVLLSGGLKICKENRTIAAISPVDYVGEMAIIETKPRSASVEAVERSHLFRIPAEQFRSQLAARSEFLFGLTRVLSQRIRKDTETLADEFEKANILIHDMRNILSVFLLLGTVAKEVQDPKLAGYLQMMEGARDNLAAMMNEALANAKRLQYRPAIGSASLNKLAADVVDSAAEFLPDLADKALSFFADPAVPDFVFNELEIRRVLLNLLINAGQASPPGGAIEVRVKDGGDCVRVSVVDHGPGIEPSARAKIFQPHFTTKPDGNGLGLVSCRRIVEKHHQGQIGFEIDPALGTAFTFSLPYNALTDQKE